MAELKKSGQTRVGGRAVGGHRSQRAKNAARERAKANGRIKRVAATAQSTKSGFAKPVKPKSRVQKTSRTVTEIRLGEVG